MLHNNERVDWSFLNSLCRHYYSEWKFKFNILSLFFKWQPLRFMPRPSKPFSDIYCRKHRWNDLRFYYVYKLKQIILITVNFLNGMDQLNHFKIAAIWNDSPSQAPNMMAYLLIFFYVSHLNVELFYVNKSVDCFKLVTLSTLTHVYLLFARSCMM